MATQSNNSWHTNENLRTYGNIGLAIIFLAEALLFSGNERVGRWFTPIVWTGFVLFIDSLLYKQTRRSLLVTNRTEFVVIVLVSIGAWWLFEFYNAPRFWKSDLELWWHYHNLEPNLYLRRAGYDWAFATIFPALFLMAELLRVTLFRSLRKGRRIEFSRTDLRLMIALGSFAALLPFIIVSEWLVPLVWLSWIFVLDPLNALRGAPSIVTDLANGRYARLAALLASGAVCGVLWEFWNYWAITKWTYTVPYLGNIKIFEMPILGYLGFPPFAVECWAIYIFCRSLLNPRTTSSAQHETSILISSAESTVSNLP